MFSNARFRLVLSVAALICAAGFASPQPASAIPLFAQRYRMKCEQCHSVLPELNAFGNYFRNNGYRLPKSVPVHGTTGVALRYQMEWEPQPAAGNRRWTPGGVLLSDANIGAVEAFLHYNLGAGGGPSALYLGYLATYNEHTRSLYRGGYIELPLVQSPGQRLDDLSGYGYDNTRVGLNDLTLASPRIGVEGQRQVGNARIGVVVDFGEYKGAAYGGKPVATGEATYAAQPEVGVFTHLQVRKNLEVFEEGLVGDRSITEVGKTAFTDGYGRLGLGARAQIHKWDLTAEQWYGRDENADGSGDVVGSTGGYFRAKYYMTPHFYLAGRYDAAANQIANRDMILYAGAQVGRHARVILEERHFINQPGKDTVGGAFTFGFPWVPGL